MKKFTFLFILLSVQLSFAQITIKVKNQSTQAPIPNATVSCNEKTLGRTDKNGNLSVKTKCDLLNISAKGFYNEDVLVEKEMNVYLTPEDYKTTGIRTVRIEDKSDPRALALLDKVDQNYEGNSPKSLASFSYKVYEKVGIDFDKDSINAYNQYVEKRLDSLKQLPIVHQTEEKKKDSLTNVKMAKLFGESQMFLWERASEILYSKKYGEKTNILDSKISGLQQPIYEMLALKSNRNQMPRQIKKENRSLYRFFLTDTLDIDQRKTYVIKFRQVEDKQALRKRKFNGYLYIDAQTFGLRKIESNSRKKNEGHITSIWKLFRDKWFLDQEHIKFRMGNVMFTKKVKDTISDANGTVDVKIKRKKDKEFGGYVSMDARYFDLESPINAQRKDFKGYSLDVKNDDGSLLETYRAEPLSVREKTTYIKLDSIGSKYKIDQKVKILTALLKGNIRAGMVDFDITSLLNYNRYEHVRVGLAGKLNEKFSRYIAPEAYLAYGFGDHHWKYGVGMEIRTSLEKNSFFKINYFDDVLDAGRFNENLWNFKMKFLNSGINFNNDQFYHFKGYKISYENDLTNALTLRLSGSRTNEEALFSYNFDHLGSHFKNTSAFLTLKFAPKSKNMMTPSGKFTYHEGLPQLFVNYEQALQAWGGDFSYSKLDFLFLNTFKSEAGQTKLRLYGGLMSGKAPIWHQFGMGGLSNERGNLNFNLTSYLGFATMKSGYYYNDKFLAMYLSHQLPWYFRTIGRTASSIDLVYNAGIGNMKNTELHEMDFRKLNHLYNEVGLKWNSVLSTPFNLGFFYKVGYYHTPKFLNNFAFQVELKFLEF